MFVYGISFVYEKPGRKSADENLFLKLLRILTPLVIPMVAYLSERLPVSGKGELSYLNHLKQKTFWYKKYQTDYRQRSTIARYCSTKKIKVGPELIFTEKSSAHASKWGCWSMPDSVDSFIFLSHLNFIFAATKRLYRGDYTIKLYWYINVFLQIIACLRVQT